MLPSLLPHSEQLKRSPGALVNNSELCGCSNGKVDWDDWVLGWGSAFGMYAECDWESNPGGLDWGKDLKAGSCTSSCDRVGSSACTSEQEATSSESGERNRDEGTTHVGS